ncbi:hypothetical protein AUP68_00080 [Ilyonectria robusta]
MSRRPHKKSKNGCLECKRRHIKCDERQPICANCGASEMRCSYLSRDSPYIVPAFSKGHSNIASSSTISAGPPTPASTSASTPRPEQIISNPQTPDPYSVNAIHFELFNNLFSQEFLQVENSVHPDIIPIRIYTKHALTTPYLMHQMLAVSALHLSTVATKSRNFYREYATGLQNRALALLNESNPVLEVTPANCIPMFLFSTLAGGQPLCDTFHYQRDDLDGFIDQFAHCLSVFRGVIAVIDRCRHLLDETELGCILDAQSIMQPTGESGSECDILWDLVNAADITTTTRDIYRDLVACLQRVFDAQRAAGERFRLPAILAWLILTSPDYIEFLRQRQPEALIILAHYAVLLHRGRDLWIIGGGGRFLLESICGSLGSEWQKWLTFPKAALSDSLAAVVAC